MASSKTDIAEAATNQSIAHAEEDKDQFKIAELEKELQALVFLILSLTSHVPNFLPLFCPSMRTTHATVLSCQILQGPLITIQCTVVASSTSIDM